MDIIAEVQIVSPILRDALAAAPGMAIELADLHTLSDSPAKYVFWARGGSFPAFEAALETDSTVAAYRLLTETESQRLYRVTFSEEGQRSLTYPTLVEFDTVVLEMMATVERVDIRARFPSRDALFAYRDACRERDVDFELKRIYAADGSGGAVDARYGVTAPQREALISALRAGYFEIPREATLEDIAEELDITEQALSTRLRRGQTNLVRNTLGEHGGAGTGSTI